MALREQLLAVAEELRRRKADGDKTVFLDAATLAAVKSAVEDARRPMARADHPPPPAAPAPALPPAAAPRPVAVAEPAPKPPAAEPAWAAATPGGLKIAMPKAGAQIPEPPRFSLPTGDKAARWNWLRDFVVNHPVCREHVRPGKKVVLGVGSLDSPVFFCGEAPGAEEEVQGEPFVGPAGQLLTKMIKAMGLERNQVYIGNIMNWRPEMPTAPGVEQVGNRPPTAEEMAFCLPFLKAQLEIVQPKLIVALGATAASGLLGAGSFKALGEVRGRWREFAGIPLMVTYHPSYLLRDQSIGKKRIVWEDLLKVMERAEMPISERQRNFFLER